MTFLATLHVDGPNDAVRTLLRLQEGAEEDVISKNVI